jgi:hypothetical protein
MNNLEKTNSFPQHSLIDLKRNDINFLDERVGYISKSSMSQKRIPVDIHPSTINEVKVKNNGNEYIKNFKNEISVDESYCYINESNCLSFEDESVSTNESEDQDHPDLVEAMRRIENKPRIEYEDVVIKGQTVRMKKRIIPEGYGEKKNKIFNDTIKNLILEGKIKNLKKDDRINILIDRIVESDGELSD